MKRRSILLFSLFSLLSGAGPIAHAQRSTERYIPLGQSPGMSGRVTLIGTVGSVDSAGRSLAVQSSTGSSRVRVTEKTRLWLDRSAARQATQVATMAELRPGRRIEVSFSDVGDRGTAEWIKIDAATP